VRRGDAAAEPDLDLELDRDREREERINGYTGDPCGKRPSGHATDL
jgi:hypothetical protein